MDADDTTLVGGGEATAVPKMKKKARKDTVDPGRRYVGTVSWISGANHRQDPRSGRYILPRSSVKTRGSGRPTRGTALSSRRLPFPPPVCSPCPFIATFPICAGCGGSVLPPTHTTPAPAPTPSPTHAVRGGSQPHHHHHHHHHHGHAPPPKGWDCAAGDRAGRQSSAGSFNAREQSEEWLQISPLGILTHDWTQRDSEWIVVRLQELLRRFGAGFVGLKGSFRNLLGDSRFRDALKEAPGSSTRSDGVRFIYNFVQFPHWHRMSRTSVMEWGGEDGATAAGANGKGGNEWTRRTNPHWRQRSPCNRFLPQRKSFAVGFGPRTWYLVSY